MSWPAAMITCGSVVCCSSRVTNPWIKNRMVNLWFLKSYGDVYDNFLFKKDAYGSKCYV